MKILKNEIQSIINDTFIDIFGNNYTTLDFDEDGFDEALHRDVTIDFHLDVDFDNDFFNLYIRTYYDDTNYNSEIAHTYKSSISAIIEELIEIIDAEVIGIKIRINSKTMNKIYSNEEAIKSISNKLKQLQTEINEELIYV